MKLILTNKPEERCANCGYFKLEEIHANSMIVLWGFKCNNCGAIWKVKEEEDK